MYKVWVCKKRERYEVLSRFRFKKQLFTLGRYGEIGYQYNSGRKQAQNVSKSGPKFATSSAKKKVVMNSTSETENVVPTDWDASAIVPPGQEQPKKGEEILRKQL